MASDQQLLTAIDVINEVRQLVGLNTIETLTADKQARVALRLLNSVLSELSNAGNWQEMLASATVTAAVSGNLYEMGVKHPVKNIYEIWFDGERQALDPVSLSDLQRYSRGGGVGVPRRVATKGVDNQSNPKFFVHPQPGSAQAGGFFGVLYFKKPPLLLTQDADVEIPFPANLVIAGLYAKVLAEEAGGLITPEAIAANKEYVNQVTEELNRFDADMGSGEDIQLQPTGIR